MRLTFGGEVRTLTGDARQEVDRPFVTRTLQAASLEPVTEKYIGTQHWIAIVKAQLACQQQA